MRANQANGTYTTVSTGNIGLLGSLSVGVVGSGVPGNNTPSWYVTFNDPAYGYMTVGVKGPSDDDLWGWE